jgi:hypothetical protein
MVLPSLQLTDDYLNYPNQKFRKDDVALDHALVATVPCLPYRHEYLVRCLAGFCRYRCWIF